MKKLKILYLEDSSQDAELTVRVLKKAGLDFSLQLVETQEEYEKALSASQPDVVLSDHSMFHFNSMEALKIFKSYEYNIPFILVTGTVSEEFAVNMLKEGANDYLLKNNLSRLPNAILNSLEKYQMEQERQQYLKNIITNEALLRQAEQMAKIGSWEVDLINHSTKWSDEVYRIYGYQPGEISPAFELFHTHIHPDEVREVWSNLNAAMQQGLPSYDCEFRIVDRTNNTKHISFKMVIERDAGANPARLIGFSHDITDKKETHLKMLESYQEIAKLEKKLNHQKLQKQKLITEVTIQAQEKERNELGKELHDNINQILTTVKMYLNLYLDKQELGIKLVEQSHNYLNGAIEEIRKLSKSLTPPSLGDMGLKEALEELRDEIALLNNLEIEMNYNLEETALDDSRKLMLYRIVQEQLNNIIKHAKASKVSVTLASGDNNILLTIVDNGIGFDTSKKAKGIGLKNILSRVQFYSGSLNIESSQGNGCRLKITLPVNNSGN